MQYATAILRVDSRREAIANLIVRRYAKIDTKHYEPYEHKQDTDAECPQELKLYLNLKSKQLAENQSKYIVFNYLIN